MSFFARAQKKIHDAAPSVQFLFDQDGPMERTIKEKLGKFFRDVPQVEEAYFARVLYPGNVQDVALCVYGSPEMDAGLVLKGVSRVYSRIVKTDQTLHTIFLTVAQHEEIGKVCRAFYRSRALC
jgi:hypothetical protein